MLLSTQLAPANDKEKLIESVDQALDSWVTYAPHLDFFRRQLQRSRPVSAEEVPSDVITMNSRFAVRDDHTGEMICYTLVYRGEEAPYLGKLSVLSPMGMALYGARVGEEVCWMSTAGPEVATVHRLIYQPEAAGHHHR
jgi:regulator of nucleoside diphosphate kinase